MELRELKGAIEGILFASGEPVRIDRLAAVLAAEPELICDAAASIADELSYNGRGIRLVRLDNMLQLCSAPEYADYIRAALETRKPPKLTQAALEVLSVVAYFQPVTRAYIESVRGVDSSYTVSVLEERGLIESCGHLDAPGRPTLFRTTPNFLRTFGLSSLQELPELPEEGAEGEDQLKLQSAIDTLSKAAEENETEAAEEAQ
ncbi:MAG: SMC-Scp complex subunit ScpB [Oscillospiraceae bacterium]|nr:SMC-Scp complex subunit ScpB [Oscillospiraceae bacterium]